MSTVVLSQINLSFGDREILRDVHLELYPGRRISLAGANGSGKTTLLRIAAGELSPDNGTVSVPKGLEVAYLPQTGLRYSGRTLWDEAEQAFASIHRLVEQRDQVGEALSSKDDRDPEVGSLVEMFSHAQDRIDASGYYGRQARIERILRGLGFGPDDFNRPCETFSGGWQMRIALAKILLQHPDVLLLDEPTNYLDIEARDWLRDFLTSFEGAVLIVAHDRDFLDHAVNETAELYLGALTVYRCNYSEYERRRAQEMAELVTRYEQQQEEIARIEDFIRRFRYNASKAAMVQSRIRMLEKMERIEIPENLKRMHLTFPQPEHSGREMIRLRGLGRSFGDRTVLSDIELTVLRGEKIAITGHNGAGKTTLLRILGLHDPDYTGTFELGSGVRVGYFGQDVVDSLTGQRTVLEEAEDGCPTELIPQLRSMLGAFLFRGDDVFKPIGVLSGGEKSRLAMLKLLLAPYNLLVLDEPTNHLDMSAQDVLLDALRRYDGTVLVVSHDRDFLRGLSERVLELTSAPGGARFRDIPGDFEFYEWKLSKERETRSTGPSVPSETKANNGAAKSSADGTAATIDRRSRQRELRRAERESERLLARAEEIESEILKLEHDLAIPENYSDGERARELKHELESMRGEHDAMLEQWESAERNADALRHELGVH